MSEVDRFEAYEKVVVESSKSKQLGHEPRSFFCREYESMAFSNSQKNFSVHRRGRIDRTANLNVLSLKRLRSSDQNDVSMGTSIDKTAVIDGDRQREAHLVSRH